MLQLDPQKITIYNHNMIIGQFMTTYLSLSAEHSPIVPTGLIVLHHN